MNKKWFALSASIALMSSICTPAQAISRCHGDVVEYVETEYSGSRIDGLEQLTVKQAVEWATEGNYLTGRDLQDAKRKFAGADLLFGLSLSEYGGSGASILVVQGNTCKVVEAITVYSE